MRTRAKQKVTKVTALGARVPQAELFVPGIFYPIYGRYSFARSIMI